MTSDRVNQILRDVLAGHERDESDSPEEADLRANLVREVAEIVAHGGIVDIPSEIVGDETPDLQYGDA